MFGLGLTLADGAVSAAPRKVSPPLMGFCESICKVPLALSEIQQWMANRTETRPPTRRMMAAKSLATGMR